MHIRMYARTHEVEVDVPGYLHENDDLIVLKEIDS